MSSLGGKNSHRRMSGARSSRASSTIFFKLRNLDRKISIIDKNIYLYKLYPSMIHHNRSYYENNLKRRIKLDEQRKQLRAERKNLKIR